MSGTGVAFSSDRMASRALALSSSWALPCASGAFPAGGSTDYGAIARALGKPQAARAVGAAVGRNPLSVIVPCHRVLGRDGALTGYAGGLDRKRWLLQLEGVALQPAARPCT